MINYHNLKQIIIDKVHISYRPAECDYCEEIYWTYSMETHHLAAHYEMNFNSLITGLIIQLINMKGQ